MEAVTDRLSFPGLLIRPVPPEFWDPKKYEVYKEQLSNKVWLFFTTFGFQEKFESNRPGKFESNGPFEPIDVAQ